MPTKTLLNPTAREVSRILRNARLQKTVWGQRLLAAAVKGRTTRTEMKGAGNWPTCACGKATALVPKSGRNGEPLDRELHRLGMDFSDQVGEAAWSQDGETRNKRLIEATNTLVNIERRAAAVQREAFVGLQRGAKQIGMKLVPIKSA